MVKKRSDHFNVDVPKAGNRDFSIFKEECLSLSTIMGQRTNGLSWNVQDRKWYKEQVSTFSGCYGSPSFKTFMGLGQMVSRSSKWPWWRRAPTECRLLVGGWNDGIRCVVYMSGKGYKNLAPSTAKFMWLPPVGCLSFRLSILAVCLDVYVNNISEQRIYGASWNFQGWLDICQKRLLFIFVYVNGKGGWLFSTVSRNT